jgi:HD-GYP domain-containing protein (c-di-GMP phosphodiesterase class II)
VVSGDSGEPDCCLAEVLAAVSLATDLGLGQPMEHVQRSCLIAMRLAGLSGADEEDRTAVYFVALLAWVGCIADSYELAALFGDDIDYRREAQLIDKTGWPLVAFVTRRAGGAGASLLTRARVAAACLAAGRAGMASLVRAHCETTGDLAARFGLGPQVREALRQTYERWDGNGLPAGLQGTQLTVATLIVTLAGTLEVFHRLSGVAAAVDVARGRSGSHFSPELVEMFCANANSVFEGLDSDSTWDMVIDAEPGLRRRLNAAELDTALEALADYIDLKSPYTLGHSRGVADLAAAAASRMGLADHQVRLVRRAGLVHDLGKVGIPNEILDKPGPLTAAEIERVRFHPYLVERIFARVAGLAEVGTLASLVHEYLDGSGYPRRLTATSLPLTARVLAAADWFHALTEPSPNRPALSASDAVRELETAVTDGRIDGQAAQAVLGAAGHRAQTLRAWPAGLTAREFEVLALLARGLSNRDIARTLVITEKTVRNHVEHIYTKIDRTSRAGAALFAMQHGLLGDVAPIARSSQT